jgi:hypothetical protein
MTPFGTESVNFRFVAQYLNHYATAVSQLHIYTVRFSHQAIIIYTQYNIILFRVVISSNVKSPVCNCNKYKHCFFYGVISLIIYFNTFFVSALL